MGTQDNPVLISDYRLSLDIMYAAAGSSSAVNERPSRSDDNVKISNTLRISGTSARDPKNFTLSINSNLQTVASSVCRSGRHQQ